MNMRNKVINREKFNNYLTDSMADRYSDNKNWESNQSGLALPHQRKVVMLKTFLNDDKELVNDYLKKSQKFLNYTESGNFSTQSSPKHLYSGSLLNASA
jgi:hypothetical protein